MADLDCKGIPSSPYTKSNKEHFDRLSAAYQPSRSSLELAYRAAKAILRNYDFDDETTEVMDFACGSGHLSQHLAPHAKSIAGVDISQGMVDIYNSKAANQGLLPDELKAICTDILLPSGSLDDPFDGQRFDLIVCASAYHHFESIDDVTRALASYLKVGGALIVMDLIQPESILDLNEIFPEHEDDIVPHRGGFKEETILAAFRTAELKDVTFQPVVNVKKKGHSLQLFLAKGVMGKLDSTS